MKKAYPQRVGLGSLAQVIPSLEIQYLDRPSITHWQQGLQVLQTCRQQRWPYRPHHEQFLGH